MVLELQTIDQLDQAAVDQAFFYLSQRLLEAFPQVDTRRGVIGDLVLQSDAILDGVRREAWNRLIRSSSLLAITENPELADPTIVDRVLSNWGVTRGESLSARGEVTIVLSRPTSLTITAGEVFVAQGQRFAADSAFTAKTASENILTSSDRLLRQVADDRWAFTINVTAVSAGTAGMVRKDTTFVPTSASSTFIRAYASSDFTGGVDAQTTTQLLTDLRLGIAARAYSNRVTTEAMIRNANPAWQNIVGMSIIGAGDAEMLRDHRGLVPISSPGRTDIYVRTQLEASVATLTRTATLVNTSTTGGIWQIAIGRDEVPGFYEVPYIEQLAGPTAAQRYSILTDTRSADTTGDGYVPDIVSAQDAAYSAYQATVITFTDPDTPTIGLTVGESTREYSVAVRSMPYIKEIQEFVGSRAVINPNGDHAVKAPVPCFVTINLHVENASDADVAPIRNAVLSYVNRLAFVPALYASKLATAVHAAVNKDIHLSAIHMLGRIRDTHGVNQFVQDRDVLRIPDKPADGVTHRTTCFIATADSIGVTLI